MASLINALLGITTYKLGYYPALTEAYEFLSKKYANVEDAKLSDQIKHRLELINNVLSAISGDSNIRDTASKTLDAIRDDVLAYIRETADTKQGGDETQANQASTLPSPYSTPVDKLSSTDAALDKPTLVDTNKSLDAYTPTLPPTEQNTLRIQPTEQTTLSTPQVLRMPPLTANMQQNMQEAFNTYLTNEIQTYEAIKHNNNILTKKEGSIRPDLQKLLVRQMLKALSFLDNPNLNADDKKQAQANAERYTFSLIQWYLLHNDTQGIELEAYDTMIRETRTHDEALKPFIDDLNRFLYGL